MRRLRHTNMPEKRKISCINKVNHLNAYERITHVGGVHNQARWKYSLDDAIRYIENGVYSFYTSVGGHERNVLVATRNGRKYLKTEADADTPDNLLSLPECS